MARNAAQILCDVSSAVKERTSRLDSNRRTRRTEADEVALFEKAWLRGQREAGIKVPSRLSPEDRRNLKLHFIRPFRDPDVDIDIEAFGHFITSRWHDLDAAYFQNAKSYPAYPNMRWLVKARDTYMLAWEERDLHEPQGTKRRGVREVEEAKKQSNVIRLAAQKELAKERHDKRELEKQLAEAQRELRRAKRRASGRQFAMADPHNLVNFDDDR